jgi:hypothetical protein
MYVNLGAWPAIILPYFATEQQKRRPKAALSGANLLADLQRRLDLEAPGFKKSFRNILGVLVSPSPFPQPSRPDVLIGAKLELLHNLLEGGHSGDNGANGLRLAPVRITTTFCHRFEVLIKIEFALDPRRRAWELQSVQRKLNTLILHIFSSKINKKMTRNW